MGESDSFNVMNLRIGDMVEVTTEHHIYTFEIFGNTNALSVPKPLVEMASNHPRFAGPKIYRFDGSTPKNSPLPIQEGMIVVGERLVFTPFLWLSPTVNVKINGVEVLPKE